MKIRESDMPEDHVWEGYFQPLAILAALELQAGCQSVVEIGCGYGTFSLPAARRIAGTVHSFDVNPEMVATTRAKAQRAGLENLRVGQRDILTDGTGLDDDSIEYVMLFNILHAAERAELLREAHRVLIPSGRLAVIHWNHDASTPRGPSMAIRPRPQDCVDAALAAGFELLAPGVRALPPYHYGFTCGKVKTA